jgi:hypothetical protein
MPWIGRETLGLTPRDGFWMVGKPHLTLQRLTPTTSCGPGVA